MSRRRKRAGERGRGGRADESIDADDSIDAGGAGDRIAARLDRLLRVVDAFAPGVHQLGPPAVVLDASLPPGLAAIYRRFDGASLFHEGLVLAPSASIRVRAGALTAIGEVGGDDVLIDGDGAVWRLERDTGETLPEGTSPVRWLDGAVAAEAELYERDGEFRGDRFDEAGELTAAAQIRVARRQLRRDPGAAAPRWRLARALAAVGDVDRARDELEAVVASNPAFAWAWFDLARISERLGDAAGARDEMRAAAEAQPDYEYAGLFWAHAARLAAVAGDEADRTACAARARAAAPDLAAAHRDGAAAELAAGEPAVALELCALALAVHPRDVAALDLRARAAAAIAAGPDAAEAGPATDPEP